MQFSVYKNTNAASQAAFPFLLDVQSNLLSELHSCVVIPLARAKTGQIAMTRLSPLVAIDGQEYVLHTAQMSSMNRKILGACVADLSAQRDVFIGALDFLISGV